MLNVGLSRQKAAGQDVVEIGLLALQRATGRRRERTPLNPRERPHRVRLGVVVEAIHGGLDDSSLESIEPFKLKEGGRVDIGILDIVVEAAHHREGHPVGIILERGVGEIAAGQLPEDRLTILDRFELGEPIRRTDSAAVEDVDRKVAKRVLLAQVDDARGVRNAVDRTAAVVFVARDTTIENVASHVGREGQSDFAADLLVAIEAESLQIGACLRGQTDFLPIGGAGEELELVAATREAGDRLVGGLLVAVELLDQINVVRGRDVAAWILRTEPRLPAIPIAKRDVKNLLHRGEWPGPKRFEGVLSPNPLGEVDLGRADRPSFSPDHDHAVGRPAPVDRRRGRRLNHFDRLDLVRVDVRKPIDDRILVARGHTRPTGRE